MFRHCQPAEMENSGHGVGGQVVKESPAVAAADGN